MRKVTQRKLCLIGHVCPMKDDRKIKTLMLEIMDGCSKKGRTENDAMTWATNAKAVYRTQATSGQEWEQTVQLESHTSQH